jgi:chemotaxis-related protein WspB
VTYLTFQLGTDLYALDVAHIVEVLPMVELKPLPCAPTGVAGVFSHRGVPTIALDVSAMALRRPAAARMSTRIVLVQLAEAAGATRRLGLIVERASGVTHRPASDFVETGYRGPDARYLGPVASLDDGRIVQRVDPRQLIASDVLDALQAVATER